MTTFKGFAFATCAAAIVLATPALAGRGGSGGDREPAGGAFMTSYPEQGSTGIQQGGPPRSVDVPRDAWGRPIGAAPYYYAPYGRYYVR